MVALLALEIVKSKAAQAAVPVAVAVAVPMQGDTSVLIMAAAVAAAAPHMHEDVCRADGSSSSHQGCGERPSPTTEIGKETKPARDDMQSLLGLTSCGHCIHACTYLLSQGVKVLSALTAIKDYESHVCIAISLSSYIF